ncbi:MAG: hypothetical protein JWM32_1899 [Verrucomicrobia bacterium]|nr:hypothetical protein [Verrucomicrobiota bacterium]
MSAKPTSNVRNDKTPRPPEVPLTSPASTEKDFPAPDPKATRQAGSETLKDDHPERMRRARTDDIDEDTISGKTDPGITSPGPARSPGSEH